MNDRTVYMVLATNMRHGSHEDLFSSGEFEFELISLDAELCCQSFDLHDMKEQTKGGKTQESFDYEPAFFRASLRACARFVPDISKRFMRLLAQMKPEGAPSKIEASEQVDCCPL